MARPKLSPELAASGWTPAARAEVARLVRAHITNPPAWPDSRRFLDRIYALRNEAGLGEPMTWQYLELNRASESWIQRAIRNALGEEITQGRTINSQREVADFGY